MAETRYCPSCGLDRREGDRFCRSCGTVLGSGATRLATNPVPRGASPAAPAAQPATMLPAPPMATPAPIAQMQPAVVASAPGPVAGAARPFKPLPLVCGVAVVVSAVLPWIGGVAGANAFDVPIPFLWDLTAANSSGGLGFILLVLGALGAGLSFVPRAASVRRIAGTVTVAIVVAFGLQLFRLIDAGGGSAADLLDVLGAGPFVAFAGGFLLQFSR